MINFHSDTYLTRGTERKLSQQTLLQFNFSSRQKGQIDLTNLDISKSKLTSDDNVITDLSGVDTEETNSITYDSSSSSDNVSLTHIDGSAETSVNEDIIISGGSTVINDGKVNFPSLIPKIVVPENDSADSDDDIYRKLLATLVVDRRFDDEGELHTGGNISLCRDPENTKDPNAVKVLSVESECSKVLGYIP